MCADNDDQNTPAKIRGVVVRSAAELEWIKEDVLSNPKAVELVEKTDKINPQKSSIYL